MNGFKEIMQQIEKWGDQYKYFVVPMTRLLNNTHLLVEPDERPPTPEGMDEKSPQPFLLFTFAKFTKCNIFSFYFGVF